MGCCTSDNAPNDPHEVKDEEKMREIPPIDVPQHYKFGLTLGSGASCRVVSAQSKENLEELVAIKIMEKEKSISKKLYNREVRILTKLTPNVKNPHAGILPFMAHGENDDAFFIVTRLLRGGELFDRIVSKEKEYIITEEVATKLVSNMLSAVKYCHDNNVVHRDLKPENFVFASKAVESDIVLIDFGCARIVKDDEVIDDVVGTAYYLAPELATAALENYAKKGVVGNRSRDVPAPKPRTGKILKAADVWSMGVIAYVMMTGRAPFRGRDNIQIFENVCLRPLQFPEKDARYHNKLKLNDHFKDFISKCLVKDPAKRISIEDAINHPWVKGVDASSYRLNKDVIHYLRQFSYQSKLKKEITKVLAANMTDEPSEQVLRHFKRLDADGDNYLDLDELTYLLLDMGYAGHVAKDEAAAMIKHNDVNGDGKLDFEEFKQVWYRKVLKTNDAYIHRVFDVFDDNKDGHIDANELGQILFPEDFDEELKQMKSEKEKEEQNENEEQQLTEQKDEESDANGYGAKGDGEDDDKNPVFVTIMNMIKEVDLNGDGKIDFDEFKAAMREDLETGKWGLEKGAETGNFGGLIGPKIAEGDN